jgi:hypothetical protein
MSMCDLEEAVCCTVLYCTALHCTLLYPVDVTAY